MLFVIFVKLAIFALVCLSVCMSPSVYLSVSLCLSNRLSLLLTTWWVRIPYIFLNE